MTTREVPTFLTELWPAADVPVLPMSAASANPTWTIKSIVDRAAAFTDLAESYYKTGKRVEAKKHTLAALEIAPTYERAQELLLKLVEGGRP